MSMATALSSAMAGLRANQASMAIISSNVANAQTPGYISRSPIQVEVGGSDSTNVRVLGVNRDLDAYLQSQLRTETSGAAYAKQMANVLSELQDIYGQPGANSTLETAFNKFTAAMQSLSGSSGDAAAQATVLGAARSLASALNTTTNSIQALRTNAEMSLSNSALSANKLLDQVADYNQRLLGSDPASAAAATLMDQRDQAISSLSAFLDVRVVMGQDNQATLYSTAGMPLVSGNVASRFTFDNHGQLNANTLYNSDPTKTAVGTLKLVLPNGNSIDLSSNAIASGSMAADLKLRDETLVQAQTQIDQFAASLAQSLSDVTTAGTAATSGTQTGFDVDTSGILAGNSITLTYTDSSNVKQTVNIVRVDDPAALPLPSGGGPANTQTIGVNFSGGMASVVTQLNTALGGAGLAFSNPSGSTLRVLNTVANIATVNAVSTTTTAQGLTSGKPQLAVFTDGSNLYTGAITKDNLQLTGYAGRINVNAALLADPSRLTIYNSSPTTLAGDTTRSDYLYKQLTSAQSSFSPATGVGSAATPFKSTLTSYLQQVMAIQSGAATTAQQLHEGQDVVVSTLQSKFDDASGVNMDKEMSNLIALQNTYAANAHVMSVIQTMMDSLMAAIR